MKNVLVNDVTLNINKEGVSTINLNLAIPVKIGEEDLKLISSVTDKKGNAELGTVSFSEKTSESLRQVAEAIRKELLAQIK